MKRCVMAGLGDFYTRYPSGLAQLPFVYNNISSLAESLADSSRADNGWKTFTPLLDDMATVKNITARLMEAINTGPADQWLLFYYTGHASKYYINETDDPVTFCVTYYPNLTEGQYPGLTEFFSGSDHQKVVQAFGERCPQGHLITVLDCCYAYGLIDRFAEQPDYHTIIASTAENFQALYTDNSVFFKEFKKVLSQPINSMEATINLSLRRQRIRENCIVTPAANFPDVTL